MALSTAVFLLGGCEESDAFHCLEDAQCGAGGLCEANGSCSFEDEACESGRRYGALAPEGIANACVPIEEPSACAEGRSCDACVTCALAGPCSDVLQSCADVDACMQIECMAACGDLAEWTCEE